MYRHIWTHTHILNIIYCTFSFINIYFGYHSAYRIFVLNQGTCYILHFKLGLKRNGERSVHCKLIPAPCGVSAKGGLALSMTLVRANIFQSTAEAPRLVHQPHSMTLCGLPRSAFFKVREIEAEAQSGYLPRVTLQINSRVEVPQRSSRTPGSSVSVLSRKTVSSFSQASRRRKHCSNKRLVRKNEVSQKFPEPGTADDGCKDLKKAAESLLHSKTSEKWASDSATKSACPNRKFQ